MTELAPAEVEALLSDDVVAIENILKKFPASVNYYKGNNISGCSPKIETVRCPLFSAVAHNRHDVLDLLLRYNVNLNAGVGIRFVGPLHFAIKYGHVDMVDRLLNLGVDVNEPWFNIPLKVAMIYCDDMNIINRLICHGANPFIEEKVPNKEKIIYTLALFGKFERLKLLFDTFPGLFTSSLYFDKRDILNVYNLPIARFLIKNADFVDDFNESYLMCIARIIGKKISPNEDIIAAIIRNTKNINQVDKDGNTFLHILVGNKNVYNERKYTNLIYKIIRFVLGRRDINLHIKNNYGETVCSIIMNDDKLRISREEIFYLITESDKF